MSSSQGASPAEHPPQRLHVSTPLQNRPSPQSSSPSQGSLHPNSASIHGSHPSTTSPHGRLPGTQKQPSQCSNPLQNTLSSQSISLLHVGKQMCDSSIHGTQPFVVSQGGSPGTHAHPTHSSGPLQNTPSPHSSSVLHCSTTGESQGEKVMTQLFERQTHRPRTTWPQPRAP